MTEQYSDLLKTLKKFVTLFATNEFGVHRLFIVKFLKVDLIKLGLSKCQKQYSSIKQTN